MSLPSSGALSLNNIAVEFGGATPHGMSEYYRNGVYVPTGCEGDSGLIPTSGQLSVSDFYGACKGPPPPDPWLSPEWSGRTLNVSSNLVARGPSVRVTVKTDGRWDLRIISTDAQDGTTTYDWNLKAPSPEGNYSVYWNYTTGYDQPTSSNFSRGVWSTLSASRYVQCANTTFGGADKDFWWNFRIRNDTLNETASVSFRFKIAWKP